MKLLRQFVVLSIILSLSFQFGNGVCFPLTDKCKKELSEESDSPLKEKEDADDFVYKSAFVVHITHFEIVTNKREINPEYQKFSLLTGFREDSFQPPELKS